MADPLSNGPIERDIEQAITALKKGSHLPKYGRRGKPKFCPCWLSADDSTLIWHSGRKEKQLKLGSVSKILPGQRTAIFQRYPRPEKECQSFSLIYNDRSLDVVGCSLVYRLKGIDYTWKQLEMERWGVKVDLDMVVENLDWFLHV